MVPALQRGSLLVALVNLTGVADGRSLRLRRHGLIVDALLDAGVKDCATTRSNRMAKVDERFGLTGIAR